MTHRLCWIAVALTLCSGCTARFKEACADIGLEPGTREFAQCVLYKEAMVVDAINRASANLNDAIIANTPQTYNIHYYRHR